MKADLSARAAGNAGKIREIMQARAGTADLYRTIEAGTSGQHADLLVGRVRHLVLGPEDFAVYVPTGPNQGARAGFAQQTGTGEWSITAEAYDGRLTWIGYASSLSVGVDVLVNGVHAALGQHDSRRISGGSLRNRPEG